MEPKALINAQFDRAVKILQQKSAALDAVADALRARHSLGREDLLKLGGQE